MSHTASIGCNIFSTQTALQISARDIVSGLQRRHARTPSLDLMFDISWGKVQNGSKGMRAKNRERISRCCSDVVAGDIIRQFIGFLRLLNIFFHMWEYLNCSGCNICIFQPTYLAEFLWKTCAAGLSRVSTCGTVLKQTVHATQHLVDSPTCSLMASLKCTMHYMKTTRAQIKQLLKDHFQLV